MLWRRTIINLFGFFALSGVLFAVWWWNDGDLGYWGFPVAFGIASIPLAISWVFKKPTDPKTQERKPSPLDALKLVPRWFLWLSGFTIALMLALHALLRPIP